MVQCKCHGHILGVECTYHSTGLAIHTDTFVKREGKKEVRIGKQPKTPLESPCVDASVELQSLQRDQGGGGEGQEEGRGEAIRGLFDGFL